MIGEVTRRKLKHLSGVPHLHVNRPLLVQNSVVVVQNNGKGKTKICFLLIRRKSVLHVQFVLLLIRSISIEAIFFVVPV